MVTATLNLHDDFSRRAVSLASEARWVPSPQPGVERRMLDRVGGEIARATSVVRYLPDSRFSRHVHGGGEEIFVLDGVFRDERGDYPAHSWLRNPRWSKHNPYTEEEGALIYVKLGHIGAPFLTP